MTSKTTLGLYASRCGATSVAGLATVALIGAALALAIPTPARISRTAISRLLRVGVMRTFLYLNECLNIPDG